MFKWAIRFVSALVIVGIAVLSSSAEAAVKVVDGPVKKVITETYNNVGQITSKRTLTANELLDAGSQMLGPGYTELGQSGSGVFRSADGLRGFRIDKGSLMGTHAPKQPHGHLQTFTPDNQEITNNHIPFKD